MRALWRAGLVGWLLFAGALGRECVSGAKADIGSDVQQLVRELAGIRRALEAGKCGGK